MQDLKMRLSRGTKLSQRDFDEFEKATDSKLPDDFKEFYMRINGGMPAVSNFDTRHEIDQIYHLSEPYEYSILDMIASIKKRHEYSTRTRMNDYPEWGLPFGSDSFGGRFILDTRPGDGYGNVWFFDPESGEEGTKLAKSFREFINGLKTDEEIEDEY